ncbi:MAG: PhoU domain-containing protein [Methanobacteriota archaeon]
MESRKIQRVGASTLSVSLPKDWVELKGLRKGDLLLFDVEGDGSLKVMTSKEVEARGPAGTEEWLIDADACTEAGVLGRVIVGNYVLGRNSLRVRSRTRIKSAHLSEVRETAQKLMGLGIMQETASEVELQCSIDHARFPIDTVLKRLYTIGATMQKDAIEALQRRDAGMARDAIHREDEADMMYWLCLRLLLAAQTDRTLAEKLGIRGYLPIVGNRLIAKNLETIADYAESIARNAENLIESRVALEDAHVDRLRRVSELASQSVHDALGCVISHDLKLANSSIAAKEKVEAEDEGLLQDFVDGKYTPLATSNLRGIAWGLRRIAEYGSEIALVGFNRYLERETSLCKRL